MALTPREDERKETPSLKVATPDQVNICRARDPAEIDRVRIQILKKL